MNNENSGDSYYNQYRPDKTGRDLISATPTRETTSSTEKTHASGARGPNTPRIDTNLSATTAEPALARGAASLRSPVSTRTSRTSRVTISETGSPTKTSDRSRPRSRQERSQSKTPRSGLPSPTKSSRSEQHLSTAGRAENLFEQDRFHNLTPHIQASDPENPIKASRSPRKVGSTSQQANFERVSGRKPRQTGGLERPEQSDSVRGPRSQPSASAAQGTTIGVSVPTPMPETEDSFSKLQIAGGNDHVTAPRVKPSGPRTMSQKSGGQSLPAVQRAGQPSEPFDNVSTSVVDQQPQSGGGPMVNKPSKPSKRGDGHSDPTPDAKSNICSFC